MQKVRRHGAACHGDDLLGGIRGLSSGFLQHPFQGTDVQVLHPFQGVG